MKPAVKTLKEISEKLSLDYKGDPSKEIHYMKDITRVKSYDDIDEKAIYFIENLKTYKKHPYLGDKGSFLIKDTLKDKFGNALFSSSKEVRLSFIFLLKLFDSHPVFKKSFPDESFIDPSAKIASSACILPRATIMENVEIGENSIIYPNVTLEPNVRIGSNTIIYPNVVVGYNCIIKNNCIIFGGTVIGADGFGYYDHGKERHKVPQISYVEIEDFVEIGSNCSIDRGTVEPTLIQEHTKIDNQVQIGHNCRIGKYVYIAGNAGISGSVTVGDRAVIAGQAGVADHVHIGEGGLIMALTGVPNDTEARTAYFGIPARPIRESHRINGALPHIPDLLKRVKELENKIHASYHGN